VARVSASEVYWAWLDMQSRRRSIGALALSIGRLSAGRHGFRIMAAGIRTGKAADPSYSMRAVELARELSSPARAIANRR
jgi:hypothetical protein